MPIKWSAVKVSEACDKVEAQLALAEPFVGEAKRLAEEARKPPNLPQYIDQKLLGLASEFGYRINSLRSKVDSMRKDIPDDAIKAERELAKHGSQQSLV